MSTKNIHTGVRNHNPNVAPGGTGSEVTAPPSAALPTVVTPPTTGTTPVAGITPALTASQWYRVEAAAKTFRVGFVPLLAALHAEIQAVPSGGTPTKPSVSKPRKQAAGLYAELLHQFPDLTSKVDPDVIDAAIAVDAAMNLVKNDLEQALPAVETCSRQAARVSWSDAAVVRSAAKVQPNKGAALEAKLATIEALLHVGKRVATSADAAAKAQTAAAKAQQKAARAAAKAARAAQTAERTAQAHAAKHPPTPDVVIVPAGTTPKP